MVECPTTFWCGHYKDNSGEVIPDGESCCFNHYVGLPVRFTDDEGNPIRHPLYDYQEDIIKKMETIKYFWILKAPKQGLTELFLRWILWRSLTDKTWKDGQVAIVVGIREVSAVEMIQRCKVIMENEHNPIDYEVGSKYNTKKEFTINRVLVKAHPAMNIDSIRSQPNMKFILADESAFFGMADDHIVRDAAEHYIGGSDTYIVYVSTAGDTPRGFMYDIGEEGAECFYERIRLTDPQKYGLKEHPESGTSLYKKKELDYLIKNASSYNRNYLGQWGAGSGNIFDLQSLEDVTQRYDFYDPTLYPSCLAVDPAYSRAKTGSKFALLGMVKVDGVIYTNYEKQLEDPTHEAGNKAIKIAMQKGYKTLVVDSAFPGIINDFKDTYPTVAANFNESQKTSLTVVAEPNEPEYKENMKMMDVALKLVRDKKVAIHETHKYLLEQLRAIRYDDKGLPDKKKLSFDLGDCFRMGCYQLYSTYSGKLWAKAGD